MIKSGRREGSKEGRKEGRKLMLMLARKFANYKLHMARITQNKQKCLIFIVVAQGRERF